MNVSLIKTIQEDIKVNNNLRLKILLILFRILQKTTTKGIVLRLIFFPLELLYRFYSEIILNIELRPKTKISFGLRIDHGFGIVVNQNAIIGSYCHLRHGVTIGCKMREDGSELPSPILGDNIEIGCNASVIGDIKIGNNTTIGVGSVVLEDIQANHIAIGNPAFFRKKKS